MTPVRVRVQPAGAGWRWVCEGFSLLKRQPGPLLANVLVYMLVLWAPSLLPPIGILAMVVAPALTVGLMYAVRDLDAGRLATPGRLFDLLRAKNAVRLQLLRLGGANLALTLGAMLVSAPFSALSLATFGEGDETFELTGAMVVFAALYVAVQMAMWYAPLFVASCEVKPLKAMFFSLVSVWQNRGAFLLYGGAWFGLAAVLGMLLGVLPAGLAVGLLMFASVGMAAALYASTWPTWRDAIERA